MGEINSFEQLAREQSGKSSRGGGFGLPEGVNILSRDMIRKIAIERKQQQSKKSADQIKAEIDASGGTSSM